MAAVVAAVTRDNEWHRSVVPFALVPRIPRISFTVLTGLITLQTQTPTTTATSTKSATPTHTATASPSATASQTSTVKTAA
jgi:hypothetical protein